MRKGVVFLWYRKVYQIFLYQCENRRRSLPITPMADPAKGGKAIFLVVFLLAFSVLGCSKKQSSIEDLQEPVSITSLPQEVMAPAQPAQAREYEASEPVPERRPTVTFKEKTNLPLPPSGPYKPTTFEIQTALKNAGLYVGALDGKMGPMTKKAIEDFQAANNLKNDGKVGPQTWVALKEYLLAASANQTKLKKR
jgi:hypothetical protein